jgi:hypothetical protein
MTPSNVPCLAQGKPVYTGIIYPITFCKCFNKRNLRCKAAKGACSQQHNCKRSV